MEEFGIKKIKTAANNVYAASEAMRLTCAYAGTLVAIKKDRKKILE